MCLLNPACILTAASATSGSFKSISTSSSSSPPACCPLGFASCPLVEGPSVLLLLCSKFTLDSFWRDKCPLKPAWILTAAFSTSGSVRSISMASLPTRGRDCWDYIRSETRGKYRLVANKVSEHFKMLGLFSSFTVTTS